MTVGTLPLGLKPQSPFGDPFFFSLWGPLGDCENIEAIQVPKPQPSLIDNLLADMARQGVSVAQYTIDVNGYTGILKATQAKVPDWP